MFALCIILTNSLPKDRAMLAALETDAYSVLKTLDDSSLINYLALNISSMALPRRVYACDDFVSKLRAVSLLYSSIY